MSVFTKITMSSGNPSRLFRFPRCINLSKVDKEKKMARGLHRRWHKSLLSFHKFVFNLNNSTKFKRNHRIEANLI